jgi:hypothetical protein
MTYIAIHLDSGGIYTIPPTEVEAWLDNQENDPNILIVAV